MDEERQERRSLEPLISAWQGRIGRARTAKRKQFGEFADEAVDFYAGPTDMAKFYKDRMRGAKNGVSYEDHDVGYMTVTNKAAELVQLFGPSLYSRNPQRTVTVREHAKLPRELYVPPGLEQQVQQQVQQIQQQAQQMLQQMQQQAGPQQPGQPPNPQLQAAAQQIQQQVQAQIQQVQAPLMQAQQMYQQALLVEQQQASIRKLKADLLDSYLNYTPHELDLKTDSRLAIDEALVKGMGLLWTEAIERGGSTLIGSFFDTVDNLLIDSDVEKISEARWIARRCVHTVMEVAGKYDIDPEKLRKYAKTQSHGRQSEDEASPSEETIGIQGDLIVYWQIYSNMGFGDELPELDDHYQEILKELGDHVYLAFVPGMKTPLNIRAKHLEAVLSSYAQDVENPQEESADGPEAPQDAALEELKARAGWPIPFWMDNAWPVEWLYYHEMFNAVWPVSHLRPAMPELKAINHANNHLLNRARETSRLIIAYDKGLEEDVSSILLSGKPICQVPISRAGGDDVSKMITILQQPQGGATELMAIKASLEKQFADRTGMTELMYSQMGGMRSAAEAQIKQSSMNIRPDDMSQTTEDWQSRVASKEALAILWLFHGEDVAPVIGQQQAQLWDKYLANEDPMIVARELDVRIEAGSTRKPNRETRVAQMQELLQTMAPVLSQVAMSAGIPGPWNALMAEMGKAHDIADIDKFLLPPPPPPQPPPPDPTKMAELQMKQKQSEQDGQIKMALGQQKMQGEQQKAQIAATLAQVEMQTAVQKAQIEQQKAQMDLQQKAMELQLSAAKGQQDAQLELQKHNLDMVTAGNKAELESEIAQQRAEQDLENSKQAAKAKEKQMGGQGEKRKR